MTMGHPTFVVGLRFKNIVADILGKYEGWGLTNDWMWKDQWQRFHSTTPTAGRVRNHGGMEVG
jgi:hypothetical protein